MFDERYLNIKKICQILPLEIIMVYIAALIEPDREVIHNTLVRINIIRKISDIAIDQELMLDVMELETMIILMYKKKAVRLSVANQIERMISKIENER
jgi:hypothetical protein